jgi:hypothetical protein
MRKIRLQYVRKGSNNLSNYTRNACMRKVAKWNEANKANRSETKTIFCLFVAQTEAKIMQNGSGFASTSHGCPPDFTVILYGLLLGENNLTSACHGDRKPDIFRPDLLFQQKELFRAAPTQERPVKTQKKRFYPVFWVLLLIYTVGTKAWAISCFLQTGVLTRAFYKSTSFHTTRF